jgi:uncharacterized protein YecE (DUF72 family)
VKRVKSLCQELDLIHCVDPSSSKPLWGEVYYLRLHEGPGYRHSYSDEELMHLKEIVGSKAYLLFNNLTMYNDALRFSSLVQTSLLEGGNGRPTNKGSPSV